jgi:transposase
MCPTSRTWQTLPLAGCPSGGVPIRRVEKDVGMREFINGLLYLLWTGCQWQTLPKDLPPKR